MITVKARYADTPWGRLGFQITNNGHDDMVMVWVAGGGTLGLWHLERFNGALNAAGIRAWIDYATPKETSR